MDEHTYVYNRLNFVNEQLINLTVTLEKMLNEHERLVSLVEILNKRIDQVSSPEYINKAIKQNVTNELNNKINYIKGIRK